MDIQSVIDETIPPVIVAKITKIELECGVMFDEIYADTDHIGQPERSLKRLNNHLSERH